MNKWLCNTNANAKIANTDPGHSESKQGQREYLKGAHSKCRDCISCFNSSEGIVQPCAAVYHTIVQPAHEARGPFGPAR